MAITRLFITITAALGLTLLAGAAHAQHTDYELEVERDMDVAFLEGTGGYGFQFGKTDYLPDGSPTEYQHPLVHGYAVGGTGGIMLTRNVALIANYEYSSARSRSGDIEGVLDDVQGEIQYHTATAGLRLYQPLGFGRLRAELALGVIFPFETELEFEYGPGVAPLGITGTGRRVENYNLGVGGHGLVGYEVPIAGPLYIATNLKLKTFQSNNEDRDTELDNFVTDFQAQPPMAVNATIEHGDGAERPSTISVQDVRLQLAVGGRF